MPHTSHRRPVRTPLVVKAASAGQFLGLVPHLVGARPRDSLVLVVFTGTRARTAIRVNLPRVGDESGIDKLATEFVGRVCRIDGADGVVPVVYTDLPFGSSSVPHSALLRAIETSAIQAGLRVTDALCVAADGYGSMFDLDLPAGGRPLEDIVETDVGRPLPSAFPVEAVLPGVAAERGTGFRRAVADMWDLSDDQLSAERALRRLTGPGRSPDVPIANEDDIAAATIRVGELHRLGAVWREFPLVAHLDAAHLDAALVDDADAEDESMVDDARRRSPVFLLEALVDLRPDRMHRHALALASALADLPYLRDVVLLTIAWGREFGEYAYERGVLRAGEPLTELDAMAMAFSGGDMARPVPTRVERGIAELSEAAAMTDEVDRAPLLSMIAWLHWTLGRGTMCGRFVDMARRIDPAYGLAELLDRMLAAGMLPEWAYRATPISDVGREWLRVIDAGSKRAA